MPTFVYMTSCDGCGHCVDICPSDIMHIDTTYRRAYNIEPNMCWECYSCVKACPQNAIDCRGYADFAPLGHSVRVLREDKKGTISWKIKFRDGREKNFVSPIRTTPWGSIKSPSDYEPPIAEALNSNSSEGCCNGPVHSPKNRDGGFGYPRHRWRHGRVRGHLRVPILGA
ncbi:MAG: adenylyl-sulfate reductase subunit beta [Alphaproteobacteria bacterium]|nr:MAG: adenylyl-sulfate reductase subunit beta [Alphaproteobacteria bacterium]